MSEFKYNGRFQYRLKLINERQSSSDKKHNISLRLVLFFPLRSSEAEVLCTFSLRHVLRHNGVHFFDISTSKSRPKLRCFAHFDFQMWFAPQPRANFHLSSFVRNSLGIIAKIRHYIYPASSFLQIYKINSPMVPYLSYGICSWGNCASKYREKVLLLQKRAFRLICFGKSKEHAVPFFLKSNCLPLHPA